MSGGFLAVQAKRAKERHKKVNLGRWQRNSMRLSSETLQPSFANPSSPPNVPIELLQHSQEDAFREADTNNDGALTIEEWTDVLSKTGHENPR